MYASHFKEPQNIRDLNKAFLGFLQCAGDRKKISTGMPLSLSMYIYSLFLWLFGSAITLANLLSGFWGCGAFGGDKIHKFLQQLCAATVTDTTLYFSSYSDSAMCNQLRGILQDIHHASMMYLHLSSSSPFDLI